MGEEKPRIIAKMTVLSVTTWAHDNVSIKMTAQYDPNLPEDRRFSSATPSASYEMSCNNPAVIERMKPGATFYVEFYED